MFRDRLAVFAMAVVLVMGTVIFKIVLLNGTGNGTDGSSGSGTLGRVSTGGFGYDSPGNSTLDGFFSNIIGVGRHRHCQNQSSNKSREQGVFASICHGSNLF